ncbi:MAG: hypothetical protein ACLUOI_26470 [Eisenbergiella sp.]
MCGLAEQPRTGNPSWTEEGTFAVGIRNFEETQTVMAVYLMDSRGDAPGADTRR